MRRIAARVAATVALGGGALACANLGSPPGGPLRTTPPVILGVTPESGAVNVRAKNIVFHFDAVVNDRGPSGDLEDLFLMSPSDGEPRVSWKRSRIEVRPRRGFQPNTAYAVTMLPGVSDLRGNVMRAGRTIVFSTGPTIPAFMIAGRVFEWQSERVAPNAIIEVVRRPDSLLYVGAADSTGQFAVGPLVEGTYTVRALVDNNRNRTADTGEPWDSTTVTVRETSPFLELLAIPRDSLPPRLLIVTVVDSVTLKAQFDRPLDPLMPLVADSFVVLRADSTPLRVARILTPAQHAAAADSATARGDTTARSDTLLARPAAPLPAAPGLPVAPQTSELRPSRRPPYNEVFIVIDSLTPVRPGATYRVVAHGVRGFSGRSRGSDRVITVPTPPPPAAGRDSIPPVRPPPPAP